MPPEGPLADLDPAAAWGRLSGDPLLAYALLAAGVLAVASLTAGWARRDAAALARPGPWAAAALAAIAALALAVAGDRVDAVAPGAWPLEGLRRLPLYLVALGYGPSVGVLAALLFAAVERTQGPLPAAEAVLLLEMAVVGWLSIAPSPRRFRWAAPAGVLVGWAMATASGGLAALAWTHRALPPEVMLEAWRQDLPGVAAAALVVALPTARWWRRAAPGAVPGIADPDASGGEGAEAILPPLRRTRTRRRSARLAPARRPRGLRRTRRRARRLRAPATPEPLRATGVTQPPARLAPGAAAPIEPAGGDPEE